MNDVPPSVLATSAYRMWPRAAVTVSETPTPDREGVYTGIVPFRHSAVNPGGVPRRLWARNVICAQRGGGVRFSPHFYTRREQLEAAVAAVQTAITTG